MKWLFLAFLTFIFQWSAAQNLVLNPSFENTNGNFCGIMGAGDFTATAVDWYSPSQGTPDLYFTSIDPSCYNFQPISTYSGPIAFKGTQMPRTGSVMAGIFAYTISGMEQREYIQVPLNTALTVGHKYTLEFHASLADYTELATSKLSMLLSVQPISMQSGGVLNQTPHIIYSHHVMDTQNWNLITSTITATEPYAYLTIGNFSSDAQTPTWPNPTASGGVGTYGAYYYIDDVSVKLDRGTTTGVNDHEFNGKPKTLIKIIDFMGRETEFKPNTPLIHVYSDGTRERVLRIEE